MGIIKVSARSYSFRKNLHVNVKINTHGATVSDLFTAIKKVCEEHPNYDLPVDSGGAKAMQHIKKGRTFYKELIEINTLGIWLFYELNAHVKLNPVTLGVLKISYPDDTPEQAIEILKSLGWKGETITQNCLNFSNGKFSFKR